MQPIQAFAPNATTFLTHLVGGGLAEGDSFDLERTVLALWYAFDGFPPTAAPRLCNFIAITATRKRPPPNR